MNINRLTDCLTDAVYYTAINNFLKNINQQYIIHWPNKFHSKRNISSDASFFEVALRCKVQRKHIISGHDTDENIHIFLNEECSTYHVRFGNIDDEYKIDEFQKVAINHFFYDGHANRIENFLLFIYNLKNESSSMKLSLKELLQRYTGRILYYDCDLDNFNQLLSDLLKMEMIESNNEKWYEDIILTDLGKRVLNLMIKQHSEHPRPFHGF